MPENSLAERLKSWNDLVNRVRPHLQEELAHLGSDHSELEAVIKEIEALRAQESIYVSRLRDATRKRVQAEKRGVEVKGRLQMGLQQRYGKRSAALHEYGLKPLATPTRVKKEQPSQPPKASST